MIPNDHSFNYRLFISNSVVQAVERGRPAPLKNVHHELKQNCSFNSDQYGSFKIKPGFTVIMHRASDTWIKVKAAANTPSL
jgi:hypothetical protein